MTQKLDQVAKHKQANGYLPTIESNRKGRDSDDAPIQMQLAVEPCLMLLGILFAKRL